MGLSLALALTALILAVPAFFLAVYNTIVLTINTRTVTMTPNAPYESEGNLTALQGERRDVTAGSAPVGAPSSYSFGFEEDNF